MLNQLFVYGTLAPNRSNLTGWLISAAALSWRA